MPRKPRFQLPGYPQHVIQRGNNRALCFFTDIDRTRYLEMLGDALEKNQCRLHAYVLMSNHVHLLLTPEREFGISHTMQDTGRRYVQYVNRTHKRSGTLWEGRYKASLVDSEGYLLTCMKYIELNPVRAGMVDHPGDYRWSSYGVNAHGRESRVVVPHDVYLELGSDSRSRMAHYRRLVEDVLSKTELQQLRESLNQELVTGTEAFKTFVQGALERQVRRGKSGRPKRESQEY